MFKDLENLIVRARMTWGSHIPYLSDEKLNTIRLNVLDNLMNLAEYERCGMVPAISLQQRGTELFDVSFAHRRTSRFA
jgi:hypothetical protein